MVYKVRQLAVLFLLSLIAPRVSQFLSFDVIRDLSLHLLHPISSSGAADEYAAHTRYGALPINHALSALSARKPLPRNAAGFVAISTALTRRPNYRSPMNGFVEPLRAASTIRASARVRCSSSA
jgi:hypothetical protein